MLGLLDQRPHDAGGGKFYKRNYAPRRLFNTYQRQRENKEMNIWFGGFLEIDSRFIKYLSLCVTVSPHSLGEE